ncbi:hypothetical protein DRQ36_01550 [bacterium]|nr:MAG: hypothetical protein DRQ36_01550 [bacterium]
MRNIIIFSLALTLGVGVCGADSGDTVFVNYGTTSTLDGVILPGEWDDASTVTFFGYGGITITSYFKHNGVDTLYIAQDVPDLNHGDQALLWFDTAHNGGATPQTDDYRLSGYYIDFPGFDGEVQGTGSSWGGWIDPSGWISASTGIGWSDDHGQIEFAISFSKLGISPGVPGALGFMVGFGDNPDEADWWRYPSGGGHTNPSSWADIVSSDNWMSINDKTDIKPINLTLTAYPNPFNSSCIITAPTGAEIEIYDITGSRVWGLGSCSSPAQTNGVDEGGRPYTLNPIPCSVIWTPGQSIASGIYLVKARTSDGRIVSRKVAYLK